MSERTSVGRTLSVIVTALLLVVAGMWMDSRSRAGAQGSSVGGEGASDEVAASRFESPVEGFEAVPRLSEERQLTFDAPEEVLEPGNDYYALLETSAGSMLVDLYEERVPQTVNNFVFLALHGFYDGVPFHRVLDGFMAQTGDPTGTGRGGPGYAFPDEIDPELTHDGPGVLSMANSGPDTNGSQFFITFAATPWLDGAHTVFGRVSEGLEVLDDITRVDPASPTAVLRLDGTLAELEEQGVSLGGETDQNLQAYLEERLGAVPAQGQTFTVDGRLGVVGRAGGVPAVGFFPVPDTLESVRILTPGNAAGEGASESSSATDSSGGDSAGTNDAAEPNDSGASEESGEAQGAGEGSGN